MLSSERNPVQLERDIVSSPDALEGTVEADSNGLHVNIVHEAFVSPFIAPISCLNLDSVAWKDKVDFIPMQNTVSYTYQS